MAYDEHDAKSYAGPTGEAFGHRPDCELTSEGRVLLLYRPNSMATVFLEWSGGYLTEDTLLATLTGSAATASTPTPAASTASSTPAPRTGTTFTPSATAPGLGGQPVRRTDS